MLVGVCLCTGVFAQSTKTPKETKSTSQTAEIARFFIARFFIEAPEKGSGYETGPLHITYSDGTEIVEKLPPLRASTKKETVFNAVGFSRVHLAEDRQTLGWTINVQNCCTSYSIPMSLVVFRHKHVLHTFAQGQMVWSWMFLQGGEHVAVVFGPVHGDADGDYQLYDVKTGKLMSEVWGDDDTQPLKPNAPEWAKRLQDRSH
jgi:hypothetical protein